MEPLEPRRLLAAIASGQTLSGPFGDPIVPLEFTFDAAKGDRIVAGFGAAQGDTNFAPYIKIVAPNGAIVGSADTGTTGFGGQSVTAVGTAPSTGTYTIRVGDNDGDFNTTQVQYEVSLGIGSGNAIAAGLADGENSGPIIAGQTLGGNLLNGEVASYTFSASPGDQIVAGFGLAEGDVEYAPFMEIVAPDGTVIGKDDSTDTGFGGSGVNVEAKATQGGIYTLLMGDFDKGGNTTAARYTVSLAVGAGQAVPADQPGGENSGPIVGGQTLTGNLRNAEVASYTFDAPAGARLAAGFGFSETDVNFQPYVEIVAPDGSVISRSETGFGDMSVIAFGKAKTAGIYTLIIGDSNKGSNYTVVKYNLTLSLGAGQLIPADLPGGKNSGPIANGEVLTNTLRNGEFASYSFAASKGDTLTSTFRIQKDDVNFAPFLEIVDPDGTVIGTADNGNTGFGGPSVTAIGTATADGIYTLIAGDLKNGGNYSDGSYQIVVTGAKTPPISPPLPTPAPTIVSLTDAPDPVQVGGSFTLTATGVANANSVAFYRESNGTAGLQTGTGGDASVGTDSTATGGYTASPATASLAAGTYTYYAVATGPGGTSAPASTTNTVTTAPPPTPAPTIGSLADSPDPVEVGQGFTLTAKNLTGTVASVAFYRESNGTAGLQTGAGGDASVGTDSNATGGYTASPATGSLTTGTYTYYAVATGPGGTSAPASTTNTVTAAPPPTQNQPPTLAALSDAPDPATVGQTVTLTATGAADADGSVVEVRFFRETDGGDVPVGVDADGSDGYSASFSTAALAPGDYDYFAVAVDDGGATSARATATNTVKAVVVPPADNQPPTLGGLTASPEPVTAGDPLALVATGAADADGTVASVEFYRAVDGGADVLLFTDTDGSDGFSARASTAGLAAGSYSYYAVAVDNGGARSARATAKSTVIAAPPIPPTPGGLDFILLDANADAQLQPLTDGAVLALADLPRNPSVLLAGAERYGSVRFDLGGPNGLHYANTEINYFYTLFRNKGADYFGSEDSLGRRLKVGDYKLTATTFDTRDGGGTPGASKTVNFRIAAEAGRAIDVTLVDADADAPVLMLTDGATIPFSSVPRSASLLATIDPSVVGSVRLVLDGPVSVNHVERVRPYTLFENLGGDYFGGSLPSGSYTLVVTPHAGGEGDGAAGEPLRLSFTITDRVATA